MGSDFWFMGLRCDYRVTQQSLLGMAAGVLLSIILLGAVLAAIAVRRFKALLLEARAEQTRSRWERGALGAWAGLCGLRASRESHGGVAGLGLCQGKHRRVADNGGRCWVGQHPWGPGAPAPGARAAPRARLRVWGVRGARGCSPGHCGAAREGWGLGAAWGGPRRH